MIKYEHVTRCIHVVQAFATCIIVIISIIIIIMAIRFVWAVATMYEGHLYIYDDQFYGTRAAANDEYEELGRYVSQASDVASFVKHFGIVGPEPS